MRHDLVVKLKRVSRDEQEKEEEGITDACRKCRFTQVLRRGNRRHKSQTGNSYGSSYSIDSGVRSSTFVLLADNSNDEKGDAIPLFSEQS